MEEMSPGGRDESAQPERQPYLRRDFEKRTPVHYLDVGILLYRYAARWMCSWPIVKTPNCMYCCQGRLQSYVFVSTYNEVGSHAIPGSLSW